ncbi:oxidoreductase [Pontiellaceae bacterium B12219]|nr:oxidoreductase [Pontiellaceae bacterium B12219]
MSEQFTAYQISKSEKGTELELLQLREQDLMPGDVTVRVEYSGLNYKDGLALTSKAPVVRRFPLIPGIDFAGCVTKSDHPDFAAGDRVLLTGYGVGETHHGGYSELARVNGDWLVPLPNGISTRQAMMIGTAGFTSMLCVMALEKHGILPDSGTVLVTGAAGGVGSVAIMLLAQLGYRVAAVTGRRSEQEFLEGIGAAEVLDRKQFSEKARPLAREQWAGAIDVAGGNTLANVLSQIKYGGAVAACGLAESMELPASVAPFILRGVTLCGIDSVMTPTARRKEAWRRLSTGLDLEMLEKGVNEIGFAELPSAAEAILAGKIRGRTVVKIGSDIEGNI